VYRAHDPRLERDVAIKVLPEDFRSDPERLRRFEYEAKAIAQLNHPNIVQVFDIGIWEGVPYLVMELVDGSSLRAWMNRKPVPVRQAVGTAIQIAQGLAAAHDAGIVHRDLKPENVMLGKDGRVRILDFGLAKLFRHPSLESCDESLYSQSQSEGGRVIGTVGYMAPEQLGGERLDGRADLFSLGVMLWEMLAGERPFRGDSAIDTMHAILHQEPPDSAGIGKCSQSLERVLRRCLEKKPSLRFQNARDLGFALESLTSEQDAPGQARRWSRSYSVITGFSALGALILGAVLFGTSRPEFGQSLMPWRSKPVEAGSTVLDRTPNAEPKSHGFLSSEARRERQIQFQKAKLPELYTQAQVVAEKLGPRADPRWVSNSLDLSLDQKLLGCKIVVYRIQWFDGDWSAWFQPGVNDLYIKSGEPLRRYWACFNDHPFEIIYQTNSGPMKFTGVIR